MSRIFRRIFAFLIFPHIRVTADSAISFNFFQYIHWQGLILYLQCIMILQPLYMFWMYSLMRFGTPLISNSLLIALWGTVSKAFEISIIVTIRLRSSFIFMRALLRMAMLFLQPSVLVCYLVLIVTYDRS